MTLPMEDRQALLEHENQSDISVTQSEFTTYNGQHTHGDGNGTYLSTSFNLMNTIIGSGLLTLPYTFMLDGYIGGLLQIIIICIIQTMSSYCIVDVSSNFHVYQYFTISNALFKKKWIGILIGLLLIIQIGGQLTAYTIIIKQGLFWWEPETQMLYIQLTLWGIVLLVLFPLSSLNNLNVLHFAGYITILVAVYIIIAQGIYYFTINIAYSQLVIKKYNLNIFQLKTLPLFTNAFSCQYQITNLYRELKDKTRKKMTLVIVISDAILLVLYILCALFGYLTFGQYLGIDGYSNILYAYSELENEPLYLQLANIFVLIQMIAHYPLPCFGLRKIIESLIWGDTGAPRWLWRWLIAFVIVGFCGILGAVLSSIGTILSFTGSIAGSIIIFVLPGTFAIKNYQKNGGKERLAIGILIIGTGVVVLVGGLIAAIYDLVD